MAAPSSDANPAMRCLFSSGPKARRIQQKREPAKDKWRNEAREFGVNGVRTQRANHEGNQDRRSGSSPPWNQHAEATEDFKHSDNILSACGVAPMREPPGPSHCRGAFEFRSADQDKYHSQEDGARPHCCSGKPDHCALRSTLRSGRMMPVGIGPSSARGFNSQNLNSSSQTVMRV